MKILLTLLPFLWASLTVAQTPTPIQVPTCYGPRGADCYRGIQVATSPPFNARAIAIPLGAMFLNEPDRIDWSVLQSAAEYALDRGANLVAIRALPDVQPYVYIGGRKALDEGGNPRLTYWGRKNGSGWETRNRPPETVWKDIATLLNAKVAQVLDGIAKRRGLDRAKTFAVVISNELCKGGRGGPNIGPLDDRNYPPDLQDQPDGYIEPAAWRMLRVIRYSASMLGIPTYYTSFEAAGGPDGDVEAASCVGSDFERLKSGCSGWTLNHYAPKAYLIWNPVTRLKMNLTAPETADAWDAGLWKKIDRLRPNAGPGRVGVMEANVMAERLSVDLPAGDPQILHLLDYRLTLIQRAQREPLEFVGIFTMTGVEGCNLVDPLWQAIGGTA